MSLASYLAAPPRVIFVAGGYLQPDYYYYHRDGLSARSALSAGGAVWLPIK